MSVRYDDEFGAVWYTLEPRDRPCFNLDLLAELRQFQLRIEAVIREAAARGEPLPVRYTVLASAVPGVFNLGGDLQLFARLIRQQDRQGLFRYAKACIDVLYPNAVNFDQPLTTITLVQGDALGGGFEAAISSNVVISERSAKYGLPEVLFNLVPGMGAYSFLIRRTEPGHGRAHHHERGPAHRPTTCTSWGWSTGWSRTARGSRRCVRLHPRATRSAATPTRP